MLNPSSNSDQTHLNQYNVGDSDNAMSSGSSLQRIQSHGDSNSLLPLAWNVTSGRPSIDISSLKSRFEPNPKPPRRRKLDTSLASAVQAEYYSLSDHSTPAAPAATQILTESEIYSRLMLKRRYGYPLYRPEPLKGLPAEYWRKGVRIGDVGRITQDGAFDFLFNVDSVQASTINPPTLPRDFETVPPIQITSEDYFRQGAQVFSDHVTQIKNKSVVTYNCSASEGAILHLPENTILFNAQNKDELYDLAARHAHNWYEYLVINRSQEITNGSLYLVTDCIKTTNWGVGVFNNHKADCDYLEFISEDQGPRRIYGWRTLGPIIAKVAPTSVDATNANGSKQNQCVFVLGFKIALNQRLWRKLQHMTPNQSQIVRTSRRISSSYLNNSSYSVNTAPSLQDLSHSPIHTKDDSKVQETLVRLEGQSTSKGSQSVILQQIFGAACPIHPSDFINGMLLLHEPDANVAIVHDSEWCNLLHNNFAVDPRRLEIKDFLENVAKRRISIMNHGCVSLTKPSVNGADDAPARASSDFLSSRSQVEIVGNSPQINATTAEDQERYLLAHDSNPLIPTTAAAAEQCPRFRILLVGRSGAGKSSLINSIFKTSLAVADYQAGVASIQREITSPHNEYLVAHDSEGYEPGDPHKFEVIKKFISKRCNATDLFERLHAVWLCITTPFANGRVLEIGDEEICNLKQLGVPVIIVFTKYDLLLSAAKRELISRGLPLKGDELLTKAQGSARRRFEAQCIPLLMKLADKVPGRIPFICVSTKSGDSLEKLVQITLKHISIPKQPQQTKHLFKRLSESVSKKKIGIPDEDYNVSPTEDYSDPRSLVLATAQRVDINSKLAASISVGKRKYWSGLASGFHFRDNTIWRCLQVIHTDIINVWNIRGMSQYLLSHDFRQKMTIIVSDLRPDVPGQRWAFTTLAERLAEAGDKVVSAGPAAVVMAPISATMALAAWVYEIYKQAPHIIRCFMGYIVDLTVIVQTLFKISAQDNDGVIEMTRVEEILNNFACSQIKENVHTEIRAFVNDLRTRFERDSIIEKIDSLIYANKDVVL